MHSKILAIFGVALVALIAPISAAQTPFQPVAVVNDSAITGFDLEQRMRLLRFLGDPDPDMASLRRKALESLVNDRLKLQYGKTVGATASEEAIQRGIEAFAQAGKRSVDDLNQALAEAGIAQSSLKDYVAAELTWNDVVRGRFQQRVNPGEAEIDAELALLLARQGKAYHLREIGLAASGGGRTPDQTAELARRLSAELNDGASFAEAVARYSAAKSKDRGGDLGWVPGNKLPPELVNQLSRLKPGQVTAPLRTPGGFSILQLVETRDTDAAAAANADPALRDQIRQRLIEQRSGRLAEGLLQDLRRDAIILVR